MNKVRVVVAEMGLERNLPETLLGVVGLLRDWLDRVPEEYRATVECVFSTETEYFGARPASVVSVSYMRPETVEEKRKLAEWEARAEATRVLADIKRRLEAARAEVDALTEDLGFCRLGLVAGRFSRVPDQRNTAAYREMYVKAAESLAKATQPTPKGN